MHNNFVHNALFINEGIIKKTLCVWIKKLFLIKKNYILNQEWSAQKV